MSVFSEPVTDYRLLRLGQSIREQRKKKGWTLKDLASHSSMSVAGLSAFENDKAALDVKQLVAISKALGVRPDSLLPRTTRSHFHVIRRSTPESLPACPLKALDRVSQRPVTLGYNLHRPLASPFAGRHMEPLHAEILPATDEEIRFVSHHHEEFFFLLRGEVEFLLKTPDGLLSEKLTPGDCMYFWSSLPHCVRAYGGRPATAIRVLHFGYGVTGCERIDAAIWFAEGSRNDLTEQVAAGINRLRQTEGLSTAELARDIEISVRRLTDIERGRKPVTIDVLLRICQRFRKPLQYFFVSTVMEKPYHIIHRAGDIARLPRQSRRRLVDKGWSQTEFRSLASDFEPRGMYPYYVKLHHPGEYPKTLHEHHGQEFAYVLSGEVTLETIQNSERIQIILSAGDMCFIDSTVPHRFVGTGASPYEESWAEVIDVFWCPLGESYLFNGDETGRVSSEKSITAS